MYIQVIRVHNFNHKRSMILNYITIFEHVGGEMVDPT